jgi:hypothetical protein
MVTLFRQLILILTIKHEYDKTLESTRKTKNENFSISKTIDHTLRALSISPDGKRLINSIPLNGVVDGGYNIHASLSKYSRRMGFNSI